MNGLAAVVLCIRTNPVELNPYCSYLFVRFNMRCMAVELGNMLSTDRCYFCEICFCETYQMRRTLPAKPASVAYIHRIALGNPHYQVDTRK